MSTDPLADPQVRDRLLVFEGVTNSLAGQPVSPPLEPDPPVSAELRRWAQAMASCPTSAGPSLTTSTAWRARSCAKSARRAIH